MGLDLKGFNIDWDFMGLDLKGFHGGLMVIEGGGAVEILSIEMLQLYVIYARLYMEYRRTLIDCLPTGMSWRTMGT
jgi:hypothetical protein